MRKVFFILLAASLFSACTTAKEANTAMEKTETITGRVVIFGSEPFTYAGIVAEDNTHYAILPPEKEKELRGVQGQLLKFTVVFVTPAEQSLASINLKGGTVTPISWEILR